MGLVINIEERNICGNKSTNQSEVLQKITKLKKGNLIEKT